MLSVMQKKKMEEAVMYYTRTTGKDYATLVQGLMAHQLGSLDTSEYSNWLVSELVELLGTFDITIADCLANKDILQAGVLAEKSRGEGEFYTPLIWCEEGRKYLKNILGDLWGQAYVYDGSCGTGNLMREANYPQDKLFMSTLLQEDVDLVKQTFPEAHVFQLDFVNGIDYDENNTFFSNNLPPELVAVLKNNEPIVFFMNPPYLVGQGAQTDVSSMMKERGMGSAALDIMYQFIYRVLTMIDTYGLTNVTMALYGGTALLHSKWLSPLLREVEARLKFAGGMCFAANEFSNTSKSVGWVVPFHVWQSKTAEERESGMRNPIILDCSVRTDDNIKVIGKHEFKPAKNPIEPWIMAKDITNYTTMPQFIALTNTKDSLQKRAVNAIGTLMSDGYTIRGTRRCMVSTGSSPDNIDITPENFWRALCSFVVRVCYRRVVNVFDNCQYFSAPNENEPGFAEWCAKSLPIFLFDYPNMAASYRNFPVLGSDWNIPNTLFPLPAERIGELCGHQGVLWDDYLHFPGNNAFILQAIEWAKPYFTEAGRALWDYGIWCIEDSVVNGKRAAVNYDNCLQAWDAGLQQIRRTKGMWTEEQESTISQLLAKSKEELTYGIYKYGFLEHYSDDYMHVEGTNLSDSEIETLADDSEEG